MFSSGCSPLVCDAYGRMRGRLAICLAVTLALPACTSGNASTPSRSWPTVTTSPPPAVDPVVQSCIEAARAVAEFRLLARGVSLFWDELGDFADDMDGTQPEPPSEPGEPPEFGFISPPPGPGDSTPPSWEPRAWEDRWVEAAERLNRNTAEAVDRLYAAGLVRDVENLRVWLVGLSRDVRKIVRQIEGGTAPLWVRATAGDAMERADTTVYVLRGVPKADEC